jgi:hypothetical protein
MQAFLRDVGRIRSNDITRVDASGTALYRSPPSPYRAGRNAPHWALRHRISQRVSTRFKQLHVEAAPRTSPLVRVRPG